MAFAAARLLRDGAVLEMYAGVPTVIVSADRKDLVRQTAEMFETAGIGNQRWVRAGAFVHVVVLDPDSYDTSSLVDVAGTGPVSATVIDSPRASLGPKVRRG
ncbi:hypothetical protein SAMN04487968_11719 [Nocardioides terrae]|uniref:Uncharacterized protein n=2 Tax=Nocardioides terrae TaxID=574651 RepID=A0A1I1NHA0_9ACTN|nr:hypothetical protein SAMN04487968_11719 [Nocardioides terrae]